MSNRKSRHNLLFIRFLALSLALIMAAPETYGWAASADIQMPALQADIEAWGRIEETVSGANGKTVYLIQDAHDSLEAQENIAELIRYFVESSGVRTVLEEGYEGPVPTDQYFGSIEDSTIRRKTAYFLMDHLRIGGAEFAHITRNSNFRLLGADNQALHQMNISWYRQMTQSRAGTLEDVRMVRSRLANLAQQYFNSELKEFSRLRQRFEEGTLGLDDYLRRIHGQINSADFPRIDCLLAVTRCSEDAEQLLSDSRAFIDELQRFEEKAVVQLADSEEARKIYEYDFVFSLYEKLASLKLSSEEYFIVRNKLKHFDTRSAADFISDLDGGPLLLSRAWERSIQNAVQFYETAAQRDAAAFRQLEIAASDSDENEFVLVYGGFHKNALRKILRDQGYSVSVISPRIQAVSERHEQMYGQLMNRGGYDFEMAQLPASASRPETAFQRWDRMGFGPAQSELRLIAGVIRGNPEMETALLSREIEAVLLNTSESSERERSEQRGVYVLEDAVFDLSKILPSNAVIKKIIGLYDNTRTLTPSFDIPLDAGIRTFLTGLIRDENNLVIVNSGDPILSLIGDNERALEGAHSQLIRTLAAAGSGLSRFHFVADSGKNRIGFRDDGTIAYSSEVEDWSVSDRARYTRILAAAYLDELALRLGRGDSNLPVQLSGLTPAEIERERMRISDEVTRRASSESLWNSLPPEEKKNVIVYLFPERFERLSYVYDSGSKMAIVTTGLVGKQQFPVDFYKAVEARVLEKFTEPPFQTFWGSGFLDITETSKVEGVLATLSEQNLENFELGENEFVLYAAMGDGGNDIPTLQYAFGSGKQAVMLPVFLSHEAVFAQDLPANAFVAPLEEVEGGRMVLEYLNRIQGLRVKDIPPLHLKRWVQRSEFRAAPDADLQWRKDLKREYQQKREEIFLEQHAVAEEKNLLAEAADFYAHEVFLKAVERFPELSSGAALAATGSYGRREMSRDSDVDGVIVVSDRAALRPAAGFLAQALQDVLAVDQYWAVVEADEKIVPDGLEDHARRRILKTALTEAMDMRQIAGDRSLFSRIAESTHRQILANRETWLLDMMALWDEHYREQGRLEGLYAREPDIKNGLGGLRDYHMSLWAAKIYTEEAEHPLDEIVRQGLITPAELEQARQNLERLLEFRNAVYNTHPGKNATQLLLVHQESVASLLGYEDTVFEETTVTAVEKMLSDYYRLTREMFRFNFKVLQQILAQMGALQIHGEVQPAGISSVVVGKRSGWILSLEKGLEVVENAAARPFLDLEAGAEILPETFFSVFEQSALRQLHISSALLNRVEQNSKAVHALLDSGVLNSDTMQSDFYRLLSSPVPVSYVLWRMKFAGVLDLVFPSLELTESLAVHDIESRYTPDITAMKEIELLDRILFNGAADEEIEELRSLVSGSLERINQLNLTGALRFALLTYPVFEKFPKVWLAQTRSLPWSSAERSLAQWLVQNKNILVEAIRSGDLKNQEQFVREYLGGDERRWHLALAATLLETHLLRPDRKWLYRHRLNAALNPGSIESAPLDSAAPLYVSLKAKETPGLAFQNIAEVIIKFRDDEDQVGRLAAIAGVLSANDLSIMTADINTEDASGNLLDYFIVRDNYFTSAQFRPDHAAWEALRRRIDKDLQDIFSGKETLESVFNARKGKDAVISRRIKSFFKIQTQIEFSGLDGGRTLMRIETANRSAALFAIAAVLADENVNILTSTIDTVGYDNAIGKRVSDTFTLQQNGGPLEKITEENVRKRLTALFDQMEFRFGDIARAELRSQDPDELTRHDLYPHYRMLAERLEDVLDPGAYHDVIHTLRDFLLLQSPFTFRHPKAMLHLIELIFSPYVDERLAGAILDFTTTHGFVGDNLNVPKLKQMGSLQSYYLAHRLMESGYRIEALSIKTRAQGHSSQPDALVYHPDRDQTFLVEIKDYKRLSDVFKGDNDYQMEKYIRAVLTGETEDLYPEELFSKLPDGVLLVIGAASQGMDSDKIRRWFRQRVEAVRKRLASEGKIVRPEFESEDPEFIVKVFDKPLLYAANEQEALKIEQPNLEHSLHPVKWELLKPVIDELLKDPQFKQAGPFNQTLFAYYKRVLGDLGDYSADWLYINYLRLADTVEERMRILSDPSYDAEARRLFNRNERSEMRALPWPPEINLTEYVKAFPHFMPWAYWGFTRRKRVFYGFDESRPVPVLAHMTGQDFNFMYGEILDNALDQGRTERVDIWIVERTAPDGSREAVLAVTNKGNVNFKKLRGRAEAFLPFLARTEEGLIINTRRVVYEGELQPLSLDELDDLPDTELLFIAGLSTKLSNPFKTLLLFWAPLLLSLGGWYLGTFAGFLSWGVSWFLHFFDILPVGGMGMGMPGARQFAERAGGRLEVESGLGITTVSLVFPMPEEADSTDVRHELRDAAPATSVASEPDRESMESETAADSPSSVFFRGFASLYQLRHFLQRAAERPHTYYFRYQDILNADDLTVSEAFAALAYQTNYAQARLVVVEADSKNEHLASLRSLGVQITGANLEEAFAERNQQMAEKYHVVVSRDRNFLMRYRNFMKANKIKGYLESSVTHFYGALLFGLLGETRAGMFSRDADGFYSAQGILQDQLAAYQQSLVIRISA